MKKLLVVLMVLAMAGMANAAIQITGPATVNTGSSVTISVSSDTEYAQGGYYLGISTSSVGSATLDGDNLVLDYAAGDELAWVMYFPSDDGGDADQFADAVGIQHGFIASSLVDTVDPIAPLDGGWFSGVGLTGGDLGMVYLTLIDGGDGSTIGTGSIEVVIPEPMTMVLLGLGGLMLRRRK